VSRKVGRGGEGRGGGARRGQRRAAATRAPCALPRRAASSSAGRCSVPAAAARPNTLRPARGRPPSRRSTFPRRSLRWCLAWTRRTSAQCPPGSASTRKSPRACSERAAQAPAPRGPAQGPRAGALWPAAPPAGVRLARPASRGARSPASSPALWRPRARAPCRAASRMMCHRHRQGAPQPLPSTLAGAAFAFDALRGAAPGQHTPPRAAWGTLSRGPGRRGIPGPTCTAWSSFTRHCPTCTAARPPARP
jgi:hypothetical protein